MSDRVCKRCFLRESDFGDIYADIARRIENLKPEERSDGALYAQRLAVCAGCESLVAGVCMKCGCYPEFRAAFIKMKCPDGDKWSRHK